MRNLLKRQNEMVKKDVVDGKNCLRIPLTRNKFALIDSEDFNIVSKYKWHASKEQKGVRYAITVFFDDSARIQMQMHNLLLGSKLIDHINGDGLDNRRCNLRVASKSQNMMNSSKRKNTRSKFKGVCWHKNSWCSRICMNRKRIHIGTFKEEKDAAIAYDKKARELFGEFAKTNF